MNGSRYSLLLCFGLICAGCAPSHQDKVNMAQCRHALQVLNVDLRVALTTTNLESASALRSFFLEKGLRCPISGVRYLANPDLEAWKSPEQHKDDIAFYCPEPHFNVLGKKQFAAVKFGGLTAHLPSEPKWIHPTNSDIKR